MSSLKFGRCTLPHALEHPPHTTGTTPRSPSPGRAARPAAAARSAPPPPVHTADSHIPGGRPATRPLLFAAGWFLVAVVAASVVAGVGQTAAVALVVLLPVAAALAWRPRLAGRVLAALVATILLPVLVAIALAVRATSRGPALVREAPAGEDDGPAPHLRFRTTSTEADPATRTSANAAPTRLGRILRPLCLDELPRLLDVVRGDATPWSTNGVTR